MSHFLLSFSIYLLEGEKATPSVGILKIEYLVYEYKPRSGGESSQATRRGVPSGTPAAVMPLVGQDCDDSCEADTSAAITPRLGGGSGTRSMRLA